MLFQAVMKFLSRLACLDQNFSYTIPEVLLWCMFVGLRKCGRMVTCFLVNYCKLLELPNEHIVQLSKINRFAVETQVISHHKVASRVLIEEKYIRT